jgi:hypothetical protein
MIKKPMEVFGLWYLSPNALVVMFERPCGIPPPLTMQLRMYAKNMDYANYY